MVCGSVWMTPMSGTPGRCRGDPVTVGPGAALTPNHTSLRPVDCGWRVGGPYTDRHPGQHNRVWMALKPLKPCNDCQRTLTRERYCLACKPNYCDTWHRAPASQRGYGHDWVKLTKLVKRRDKGLCQECLRNGKYKPGRDVDHTVPKAQGGTDDPSNLELLCVPCHQRKTQREAQAGRIANRL